MSKLLKLPNELKQWKVEAALPSQGGNAVFEVSKKEYDGTVAKAKLIYIVFKAEEYTSENVDFIYEEADFIRNISKTGNISIYSDVFVNNTPTKEKIELYILTENLSSLSETLKSKQFTEAETVDFGIKLSEILEKLAANNVYHGNICPDNIYVTANGDYKLGGFTDFEGKISDMSFVAPEIGRNENADFTTDIYSLGLIMYYLCNNNTIPFVGNDMDKDAAIAKRLEGKPVSAPENGSEKLKSVIVIACQPDNKNRWKNAGNIKNALTSIKSELVSVAPNADVIVPETTDFSGNVFDEYEYDSSSDENVESVEPMQPEAEKLEPVEEDVQVTENENQEQQIESDTNVEADSDFETIKAEKADEDKSDVKPEEVIVDIPKEPIAKADEVEIDNRVFDEYEPIKTVDFKQQAQEKDYGSYFDDEPEIEPEKADEKFEKTIEKNVEPEKKVDEKATEYDVFSDEPNDINDPQFDDDSESGKGEKKLILLIVIVAIVIAALGIAGYFAFANHWFGLGEGKDTQETTVEATTEEETTVQATTEPETTESTTAEPTTAEEIDKFVFPVVGYGYYYAKDLLENEGFVVEVGEYRYSDVYDEGYVISQTPEANSIAETGSVITLDVSLGSSNSESSDTSSNDSDNNSNESSDSYYSGNSSYMSQSEVENMSRDELNFAINEIYARRGRIFNDPELSAYFNSQAWYTPKYTAEEFSKYVVFNEYEEANLRLLINEQQSRGYR